MADEENKTDEQQEEGQENDEQQENEDGDEQKNEDDGEEKKGEKDEKSKQKKKPKKPHRGPPSPTPEDLRDLEQGFILDNIAVGSISKDYANVQPKLGPAIPPYNSQKDKHVMQYYGFEQVDKTLKRTGQTEGGTSIDGPVIDRFMESGAGYRYLSRRNAAGAGHSTNDVDGHAQFMQGVEPMFGWHGQFGFRRNTPPLRRNTSSFGSDVRSPNY